VKTFDEAMAQLDPLGTPSEVYKAGVLSDKATYLANPEFVRLIRHAASNLAAHRYSPNFTVQAEGWLASMFHYGADVGRLMERQDLPEELLHG
jgi:hypothetical protein